MTANTAIKISELDYNEIRNNLVDFLRSQSEFSDYAFEGSAMSILLDLLAYNTAFMAYHLNMAVGEMFIDSIQLRENMISRAKDLNYLPNSRSGAVAKINITVTPGVSEDNTRTSIVMNKNTLFLSQPVDGQSYNFVTIYANSAVKTANNTFEFKDIWIKQGEPIVKSFIVTPENSKQRFTIPSANVDISTLTVKVQESTSNTFSTIYTQSKDITEVTANSTVFYVEENPSSNGSYTVQFGDGVLGRKLANNNLVILNYLDTQGSNANKANNFSIIDDIDGYSANIAVVSFTAASAGTDKETIEQIRFRAPRAYTAQNRIVTQADYETILLKDYPYIESIAVWGGEEEADPIYGKVYISLKPKENYYITLDEKERIKNEIIKNRSV